MPALTWDRLFAWWAQRHHLDQRLPDGQLTAAASRVCGIHSQIMSAAELSLAARLERLTPGAIQDALEQRRSLVRVWSMRGTLHLHPADELPLWVAAHRTRPAFYMRGSWLRYHGVTLEEEIEGILAAIPDVLDGEALTREELARELARELGPRVKDGLLSGWGALLKPAAFQGHLCHGPSRGQSVTFVRPARWLGTWQELDPRAALREVTRRYLAAYGPVSHQDFARWWATSPAEARRLFRSLADELEAVEVDGYSGWMLKQQARELGQPTNPPAVRLLPNFDVFVVGSYPREAQVPQAYRDRVFRQAGWISPVGRPGGRAIDA